MFIQWFKLEKKKMLGGSKCKLNCQSMSNWIKCVVFNTKVPRDTQSQHVNGKRVNAFCFTKTDWTHFFFMNQIWRTNSFMLSYIIPFGKCWVEPQRHYEPLKLLFQNSRGRRMHFTSKLYAEICYVSVSLGLRLTSLQFNILEKSARGTTAKRML